MIKGQENLRCPCGHCLQSSAPFVTDELMKRLQRIDTFNPEVLFEITSGYRCSDHNAAVGGEPNSQHIYGNAVDFAYHSSTHLYEMMDSIMTIGSNFVELTPTHVHLDVRENQAPQMIVRAK